MNGKLVDTNILIYLSKRKLKLEQVTVKETRLFIPKLSDLKKKIAQSIRKL